MDKLVEYYNKFNEDKRLLSPHGKVEYIISMKYIHKYLEKIGKNARILDVGAGTGAYSVPLCEEGYEVHALECEYKSFIPSVCLISSHISIYGSHICLVITFTWFLLSVHIDKYSHDSQTLLAACQ